MLGVLFFRSACTIAQGVLYSIYYTQQSCCVKFNMRVQEVTCNDLTNFLSAVNFRPGPSIFDLGGKTVYPGSYGWPGRSTYFITASNVTIRNGTLALSETSSSGGPVEVSLGVQGKQVLLDNVIITGGKVGMDVSSEGHVILKGCQIKASQVGGVVVRGGRATLHDCLVTGVHGDGIRLEDASSKLEAAHVRCGDNSGHGLYVSAGDVLLDECVFAGNKTGSICVVGINSRVELRRGRFEPAPDVLGGGQVDR